MWEIPGPSFWNFVTWQKARPLPSFSLTVLADGGAQTNEPTASEAKEGEET